MQMQMQMQNAGILRFAQNDKFFWSFLGVDGKRAVTARTIAE
jgi:hypothetical protein